MSYHLWNCNSTNGGSFICQSIITDLINVALFLFFSSRFLSSIYYDLNGMADAGWKPLNKELLVAEVN
jgi:hypothetical protein